MDWNDIDGDQNARDRANGVVNYDTEANEYDGDDLDDSGDHDEEINAADDDGDKLTRFTIPQGWANYPCTRWKAGLFNDK